MLSVKLTRLGRWWHHAFRQRIRTDADLGEKSIPFWSDSV